MLKMVLCVITLYPKGTYMGFWGHPVKTVLKFAIPQSTVSQQQPMSQKSGVRSQRQPRYNTEKTELSCRMTFTMFWNPSQKVKRRSLVALSFHWNSLTHSLLLCFGSILWTINGYRVCSGEELLSLKTEQILRMFPPCFSWEKEVCLWLLCWCIGWSFIVIVLYWSFEDQ